MLLSIFGALIAIFPGGGVFAILWLIAMYAILGGVTRLVAAYRLHAFQADVRRVVAAIRPTAQS